MRRRKQLARTHDDYHNWYYETGVWRTTTWLGVPARKSVSDMWNYQEILSELRPALLVEFGTQFGGSALFFASILSLLELDYHILTVDPNDGGIHEQVKLNPRIERMKSSSIDDSVLARIRELRSEYPTPMFAILDSLHAAEHVLAELELLSHVARPGDYLVVEDGNVNGHPVRPNFGPGPYEAVDEFLRSHGSEFVRDVDRETKFGFTFSPGGFLRRV